MTTTIAKTTVAQAIASFKGADQAAVIAVGVDCIKNINALASNAFRVWVAIWLHVGHEATIAAQKEAFPDRRGNDAQYLNRIAGLCKKALDNGHARKLRTLDNIRQLMELAKTPEQLAAAEEKAAEKAAAKAAASADADDGENEGDVPATPKSKKSMAALMAQFDALETIRANANAAVSDKANAAAMRALLTQIAAFDVDALKALALAK